MQFALTHRSAGGFLGCLFSIYFPPHRSTLSECFLATVFRTISMNSNSLKCSCMGGRVALKNRLSRMGRSWWRTGVLYVCMGSGRTRKSTRSDCAADEKRKKYTASYHNRVKYGEFFCVTSCVFSAPFFVVE